MTRARAPEDFRILLLSPALVDEPLGLMYLAGALQAAGYDVSGVLFNRPGWDAESLIEHVRALDPDVVAVGVITGEHRQCLDLTRQLRDAHDHFTVMGGPFLTFAPETVESTSHVDAVARGECEVALVELCERLRTQRDHTSVPNFWFRDGDRVVRNPIGPTVDVGALPRPDRDVFGVVPSDGTYNLMSSRGCPYKCTYCFNDRYVELHRPLSRGGERLGDEPSQVVRNRDIDDVVAEMRELVASRPVEQFNFHDDIFPLKRSRTLEFCDAYLEAGIGVPWSCSVKAELLDEELVLRMAKAGCNKVYMGVEAADDVVRNELLLRRVSRERMVEVAEIVRAAGIQLFTQSMVGLPGGTLDDDIATMAFNAELRPAFAWVSIFTPYPGTALADRAHALGLVDEDFMSTMPNTYHYRSILRTGHAEAVSRLHKVFSVGVEHPELIDALVDLVRSSGPEHLDALHRGVFLPFRQWKHDLLRNPTMAPDDDLAELLAALAAGRTDDALAVAARSAGRRGGGPPTGVEAPTPRPAGRADTAWTARDGVDVMVGIRPPGDRAGAEP